MDRLGAISGHLINANLPKTCLTGGHRASDDDVVIVTALRTPICKSKRGNLKVNMFF